MATPSSFIRATKQSISSLENTARLYAQSYNDGEWPTSLQELMQPINAGGRVIQPLLDKIPLDAWGTPLTYQYSPSYLKPLITSYGPNKKEGGGDDITNYDDEGTFSFW